MKPLPEKRDGYTYIYALVDPRDHRVRYVGATTEPRRRFNAHICGDEVRQHTYKARWVRVVLRANLRPVMVVLETCEDAVWETREDHWIAHYRGLYGRRLTNATNGGRGWRGMRHSEAARAKMGAWQRGRRLPPEHLKNMAQGHVGHAVSAETRQRIREGNLGKTISEEQKVVLRERALQNAAKMTAAERRKMTAAARKAAMKKRPGFTSCYLGVCWNRGRSAWQANIRNLGRSTSLGLYDTEVGAASAYNREARRLYGNQAVLNTIPGGEVLEPRRKWAWQPSKTP